MTIVSPVPPDEPALHLAVAFVNTYDLLADPPDFLSTERAGRIADRYGQPDLAKALRRADLDALRAVRDRLYRVFAADADGAKVTALDELLVYVDARARMVDARIAAVSPDNDPVRRLGALCADALARAMAVGGPERFGTCAGHPCRCGYVDRTRAGRQRFCCQLCNDRMAAAAYRERSREGRASR
jgi:predicted RNA-binding Zn ribbon-like protein